MKRMALVVVLLVACQKQEDPSSNTTAVASASASAITTASVTPLTPIDPAPSASAASNTAPRDAGPGLDEKRAALSQQAEAMQMQMLRAFASSSAAQGALNRSDIPPVDLSQAYVRERDAGRNGDLKLGSGGGGALVGGPGRGGLSGIGARDH